MNRIAIPVLSVVTVLSVGSIAHASMPSFRGLGAYGNTIPLPHKISADGNVIIGWPQSTSGAARPFAWCYGLWHRIDASFAPDISFSPRGISADGSVIVGRGHDTTSNYWGAYRLADGGITPLEVPGFENAFATDVSGDGSIIVGYATRNTPVFENRAVRWDNGVATLLPEGADGSIPREASAISTDGTTIVGYATVPGIGPQAFRATDTEGLVPFRTTRPDDEESYALAVSATGEFVAVTELWAAGFGYRGFRWDDAESIDVGATGPAWDVSADGSIVIAGYKIWQEGIGTRSVEDFLSDGFGIDLTGWMYLIATGISDDGTVVFGTGTNPDGDREGWIATIPEPASVVLLLVGAAMVGSRRRRALGVDVSRRSSTISSGRRIANKVGMQAFSLITIF